ncbi:unnamed protein product, partial [Heterotrigona itama]
MVGLTVCGLPSLGEVARIGEQPRGNGTAQTLYRATRHQYPHHSCLVESIYTQRVRTNGTEPGATSKKKELKCKPQGPGAYAFVVRLITELIFEKLCLLRSACLPRGGSAWNSQFEGSAWGP